MTNEVFARTWGERAGPAPAEDYWPAVIGAREGARTPSCCSSPRRTGTWSGRCSSRASTTATTSASTTASCTSAPRRCAAISRPTPAYQERLIRFIENHDEPRAAADVRRPAQARAAAVVDRPRCRARGSTTTASSRAGATHIPVFLGRGPDEPADAELRAFYERLLRAVADSGLRDGDWRLCDVRRAGPTTTRTAGSSRGAGRTAAARASRGRQPLRRARAGARAPAVGRPRRPRRWSWPTGSTGSASSAPATSSRPRASTSALDPVGVALPRRSRRLTALPRGARAAGRADRRPGRPRRGPIRPCSGDPVGAGAARWRARCPRRGHPGVDDAAQHRERQQRPATTGPRGRGPASPTADRAPRGRRARRRCRGGRGARHGAARGQVRRVGGAGRENEREEVRLLARHAEHAPQGQVPEVVDHVEGEARVGEDEPSRAEPAGGGPTTARRGPCGGIHDRTVGRLGADHIARYG